MKDIKKEIESLEFSVETIIRKKLFYNAQQRYHSLDYKRKEQEYYKKDIENKVKAIQSIISDFLGKDSKDESAIERLEETKELFNQMNISIKKFDEDSLRKSLGIIKSIKEKTPNFAINSEANQNELNLPELPKEIYPEIRANFDELSICLENKCYRSVLILSGKILEIALHRKYFEVTGRDLLEKSPDIGLGNLLAKMRENNTYLDPGLTQQIHLINQLRVFSVHKKPEIFFPSREQAKATVLYTIDILKKLFKR